MNILQAIRDPKLFAPWFVKRGDDSSWAAWFAFLSAAFALPMTEDRLAVFKQCTGREQAPTETAKEVWLICGRRSGKSFILALIAVYLATFHDYAKYLTKGERGVVLVLASDRRQARVIFRYVRGLLTNIPMLARMIEKENDDTIDLKNSVSIEIATASFRAIRGYTVVAALTDEIAFWQGDDSASPDSETLDSIRPSMATIPNAMLLACSSPHSKKGALYAAFKDHYGKAGDVLVWRAPTRLMNPTVSQKTIDAAYERDAAWASAEYGAEFRNDLADFVDRETVMACVERGTRERARQDGVRYRAFVDPSGGSSDSMTLCVGHRQKDGLIVVDALREIVAPFDPESAADEFASLIRAYGCSFVHGDRYAAQWTAQAFEKRRVGYRHSELAKSNLYLNLLPHLNGKTIKLLDSPRSINQLASLERKTYRGGKDSVDHAANAHDDLANSIAGLAYVAARGDLDGVVPIFGTYGMPNPEATKPRSKFDGPCTIVGADGSRGTGWATAR